MSDVTKTLKPVVSFGTVGEQKLKSVEEFLTARNSRETYWRLEKRGSEIVTQDYVRMGKIERVPSDLVIWLR